MCAKDKEKFSSFAFAQVSVSNEIYNHLNCPRFLFCPTQYCTSRALPDPSNSEYLNTLGEKLLNDICKNVINFFEIFSIMFCFQVFYGQEKM
jgi:protein O-GlcNAcase / histone acetyltransferase